MLSNDACARAQRLVPGLAILLAALMGQPVQAQSGDQSIMGVTAVNVSPAFVSKTMELLRGYRDAAARQPGAAEIVMLQEIHWPNRFIIYESWSGQINYDDNEKSPQTTKLRDELRAIDGSIDRRNTQVISIDTPRPAPPDSVYVHLHLDVFPPGLAATLEAGRAVAKAARSQPDNFRYDVTQSVKPPVSHTTFLAVWSNLESYNSYQNSKYARQFRETIGPLLGSPFDERIYARVN